MRAAADPTNAALLKEYGFTDFEAATYKSDDGRTLKIRAARFADASGAFGAYTFYLQPEMAREEIGDQGASLDQRVLFYRGHILVDALFSQLSVMSAAGLRELAGVLPRPSGNAGNLPPILAFMPHHGYQSNTEKYAEGPLGLEAISSPLTAALVDFGANPEVVLGQYSTSGRRSHADADRVSDAGVGGRTFAPHRCREPCRSTAGRGRMPSKILVRFSISAPDR